MATIFDSHFAKQNTSFAPMKPTQREVDTFGQALKSPEFRAMLCDYVQEVSDPANREKYVEEMTQLEADKGNNVTFLIPQPGYVIKTRVLSTPRDSNKDDFDIDEMGKGKVFVNVCGDEHVEDAKQDPEKRDFVSGRIPWAIPFSSSKPRRDVDKAGEKCVVYDVIFHPNVIRKTSENKDFRSMVNLTALDGLEKFFDIKLDRKRVRFPKMHPMFKGSTHVSVIRRPMTENEKMAYQKSKSKNQETSIADAFIADAGSETATPTNLHQKSPVIQETSPMTSTPKYVIKYRYVQRDLPLQSGNADPCRPTSMVVEISLPEMSSAKGIDLDVLEHLLTLEASLNTPVAYKLVLKLPYPVHDDQGSAKFDKSQHVLAVTLPVKSKEAVSRLVSVDSGIGLEFVNIEQSEQSQEEQDLDSGLVLDDVAKDDDLEVVDFEVERSMPPYVCNIYEGLMVVTMALRNVVADSLNKTVLKDGKGYYLTFHTMGEGFVPIYYGFCLSFDFEAAQAEGDCHLDDLEVEVWNNNMIVQLSMPKLGCQTYQVGNHPLELGEPLHLPRLQAVKEKCYLLGKKNGHNVMKKPSVENIDSDDSNEETENNAKERHSSGDSNDSAVSFSVPTSPTKLNEEEGLESPSRFLVIPSDFCKSMKDCNLRGILRRPRCSSESATGLLRMMSSPSGCSSTNSSGTIIEEDENEMESGGDSMGSKKSVTFNEVVLRQVYRTNSSTFGQKHKNQKKAEQKRRKAARRSSEGDTPSSDSRSLTFSADESEDQDHTNDSGLASEDIEGSSCSPMEANNNMKIVVKTTKQSGKNKGKRPKVASRFLDESQNSDLIFNLDFY